MMAHNADYQRSLVKGSNTALVPNWWRVCFVHGDQTKYYRKLYGRKSQVRSLALVTSPDASLRSSEADQDSM